MIRRVTLTPSQPRIPGNYQPGDTIIASINATDAAFTISLPDAKALDNVVIYLKKIDTTANAVTIQAPNNQTIDDATTLTMTYANDAETIISDRANFKRFGSIGYGGANHRHYQIYNSTLTTVAAFTNASGNFKIGEETAPQRRLHVEVEDDAISATTYVARFSHTTIGDPQLGMAVGIEFETEVADCFGPTTQIGTLEYSGRYGFNFSDVVRFASGISISDQRIQMGDHAFFQADADAKQYMYTEGGFRLYGSGIADYGSDGYSTILVRDSSGWVYVRTKAQLLSDIGAAPIGSLHAAATVADTTTLDLTISGQQISGAVIDDAHKHSKLYNYTLGTALIQGIDDLLVSAQIRSTSNTTLRQNTTSNYTRITGGDTFSTKYTGGMLQLDGNATTSILKGAVIITAGWAETFDTTDGAIHLRTGEGGAVAPNRLSIDKAGTVTMTVCANASADVDKFLVLDTGNNIDYRTGAEVLSDIGAQPVDADLTAIAGISVARGSIISGQGATPAWAGLALGDENTILSSDGTDVKYQTAATLGLAPLTHGVSQYYIPTAASTKTWANSPIRTDTGNTMIGVGGIPTIPIHCFASGFSIMADNTTATSYSAVAAGYNSTTAYLAMIKSGPTRTGTSMGQSNNGACWLQSYGNTRMLVGPYDNVPLHLGSNNKDILTITQTGVSLGAGIASPILSLSGTGDNAGQITARTQAQYWYFFSGTDGNSPYAGFVGKDYAGVVTPGIFYALSSKGSTFKIYGDNATTVYFQVTAGGNITIPVDSKKLIFGGGADSSIMDDGTNMVFTRETAGGFVFSGGKVNIGSNGVNYGQLTLISETSSNSRIKESTGGYLNLQAWEYYFWNNANTFKYLTIDNTGKTFVGPINTNYGQIALLSEASTTSRIKENANGYLIIEAYEIYLNTGVSPTENVRITYAGDSGFGTTAPDKKVEINSATGDCLRLTYNDADGSATNYADFLVSSSGDIDVTPVRYAKVNKMLYGSMYGDDVSITINVSAASTYYAMGAGLTGGTCNGFTHANSTLTAAIAGKYKIDWSATLYCATANQKISMAIMINSTAQPNTEGSFKLTTANDEKCVAGSGIITLAANDVVKMCVENETGTNNIIVTHVTCSLVRVDA